jgi:hypothetical protein
MSRRSARLVSSAVLACALVLPAPATIVVSPSHSTVAGETIGQMVRQLVAVGLLVFCSQRYFCGYKRCQRQPQPVRPRFLHQPRRGSCRHTFVHSASGN